MWYKHLLAIQVDYWDFMCNEETVYLSVETEMQRKACWVGHMLRAVFFAGEKPSS